MTGRRVGDYEIRDRIGGGGIGEVFRGVDPRSGRAVAVKLLRSDHATRPDVVERFRNEAETLGGLDHENIAALIDVVQEGPSLAIVMEHVTGRPLSQLLRTNGALPLSQALPLFLQALEGVGYAHARGVMHLDLKSANLVVGADGTVKVTDFGTARCLGDPPPGSRGPSFGTPGYVAPEQIRGLHPDARADIYSLGVVLYEMLTGRTPFEGETERDVFRAQLSGSSVPLAERAPEVPEGVALVIGRALERERNLRFASTAEFRSALESALPDPAPGIPDPRNPDVSTDPIGMARRRDPDLPTQEIDPVGRGPARLRWLWGLLGLAVAVLILSIVGLSLVRSVRMDEAPPSPARAPSSGASGASAPESPPKDRDTPARTRRGRSRAAPAAPDRGATGYTDGRGWVIRR